MEAYRDQYATVFKGGKGVTVIGISADVDTMQYDWARDSHFPVTFASDTDLTIIKRYGVKYPAFNAARRVVFVIDASGHITHVMDPFKELNADSYTELTDAVARAAKGGGGAGGAP
jgi:peroxiredoxin Q/BCP